MDYHFIPERIRQELLEPNLVRVGDRQAGGLSGALVWRSQSFHGCAALRCWPREHPSPARLALIHAAMQDARRLGHTCIPNIYCNRSGGTFLSDGERLWELTQWMPGRADYQKAPSTGRLNAALQQLARLHCTWARANAATVGISPTLSQRCDQLELWIARLPELTYRTRWTLGASPQLLSLASGTVKHLIQRGDQILGALQRLRHQQVVLHFALRDIWSDHVLFTDERVTGIVDFGAARVDEPATDVARLLGSMEPFNAARWQCGWEYYREINASVERERVESLDRAATLLSALQWLEWLVIEPRAFEVPAMELIARWQRLVSRLETF